MEQEQFKYVVKTPEINAGAVMGKLSLLEVAVEDVDVTSGEWTIKARSINSILNEFRPWLEETTNGKGLIEEMME